MESKTQAEQLRCLSLSMMSPILKTINGKKLGGVDSQRVVSPPTQGISLRCCCCSGPEVQEKDEQSLRLRRGAAAAVNGGGTLRTQAGTWVSFTPRLLPEIRSGGELVSHGGPRLSGAHPDYPRWGWGQGYLA